MATVAPSTTSSSLSAKHLVHVPQSRVETVCVWPSPHASRSPSGLASSYRFEPPAGTVLAASEWFAATYPHVSRAVGGLRGLRDAVDEVNEDLAFFWPCVPCQFLVWLLALPTLGLSVLVSYVLCYREAELAVQRQLARLLQRHGGRVRFSLRFGSRGGWHCRDSWLQVEAAVQ